MNLSYLLSAVLLQTGSAPSLSQSQINLLMVFAGAVTLTVLIQSAILISFAIAGAKARKEIMGLASQLHKQAMPLIASAQSIVDDVKPKMKTISSNAVEISEIVRSKAVEIDAVVSDLSRRTHRQAVHVDQIATDALNGVEHISHSIQHAILGPVKQFVGAVAAVKAAVEKLKERYEQKIPRARYDSHEGEERMGEGEDYHA